MNRCGFLTFCKCHKFCTLHKYYMSNITNIADLFLPGQHVLSCSKVVGHFKWLVRKEKNRKKREEKRKGKKRRKVKSTNKRKGRGGEEDK